MTKSALKEKLSKLPALPLKVGKETGRFYDKRRGFIVDLKKGVTMASASTRELEQHVVLSEEQIRQAVKWTTAEMQALWFDLLLGDEA